MKKITSMVFFWMLFILLTSSSVFAHSDQNHSACSKPEQTTEYDSKNPWASSYTYEKAIHKWEAKWAYVDGQYVDNGKWVDDGYEPATGECTISSEHTPFENIYTTGVIQFTNVKGTGSPGGDSTTTSGVVYWVTEVDLYLTDGKGNIYSKYSSNGTSQTASEVDGNINNENDSGLTTYVDEDMPIVSCVKLYADQTQKPCNAVAEIDTNMVDEKGKSLAGQRLTCYRSVDVHSKDSDKVCTVRVYVKDVNITSGANKTYTGKHYNYECQATFYDGSVRVISQNDSDNQKYVWLSYPSDKGINFYAGRYIGSHWEKGYLDPQNTYHKPDSLHDFYPVDTENRTYVLNCTYYPGIKWVEKYYANSWNNQWQRVRQNNDLISDYDNGSDGIWHREKHDEKTVTHIGIAELWVEAEGEFLVYQEAEKIWTYQEQVLNAQNVKDSNFPGTWNLLDTVNNHSYAPGYWNQYLFLTGHWYDFKAYIRYTDGTKRDITSADEISWTNTPPLTQRENNNGAFSKTGLNRPIPVQGWNTIDVEYFHQHAPYGKTEVNRTKVTNRLKAKQMVGLEITHKEGKNKPPIQFIDTDKGDSKVVQYHVWFTWSDNLSENWTNFVAWSGDYAQKNPKGMYDFSPMKGKEQKTSIYANYREMADQLEVVVNDCKNIPHLAWGCDLPQNYWRIDLQNRFDLFRYSNSDGKNSNFYPDPAYYNVDNWHEDKNLYMYQRKFPVSGTSAGLGNQ